MNIPSGLPVRAIWFENGDGVVAGPGKYLKTHNDFHGEYDLDLVLVLTGPEVGAKEVARHNVKYICTIIFEADHE